MIVVDATKNLLVNVLEYHPFLIKPNNYELGEIFGVTLSTKEDVILYAKKLQEMGAANVLVSMAGDGAVLVAEDGSTYKSEAPEGKVKNSVGAGDSMVAGFVAGWMEKKDYEHAFHMGIAAGSASAFSENLATKEEIEAVYGQITENNKGEEEMRITDLLDRRSVSLTAAPKTKSETLDMAVDLMVKSEKISDREAYRKQVYLREEESTTGIGEGIAIPHGKCDAVEKPGLAAMVIPGGVDFDSLDGEPVTLLFLIAAPNTEDNVHLDVLSKLSMMLMDEEFTKSLRNARTPEEFLAIIDRADEEKKSVDERLAEPVEAKENQVKILAVTSCPTGIAHTYMAAEGIEKAAKAKGCFVKVETRGSGGAKNVLTAQEIADADCIIVAADAQVPMDRFDGKKVIQRQVSDGISKADELIELAMSGNAPVYKSGNAQTAAASTKKNSGGIGHQLYTQLMNGVSHMLPFVVGGGILIAIAFLIDGLLVDMNSLDAAARSNFGTITPAAAMFKQIGGVAFGFMPPGSCRLHRHGNRRPAGTCPLVLSAV